MASRAYKKDNALVLETSSISKTEYVVKGPKEDVEKFVNYINSSYPSGGYSTTVDYSVLVDGWLTATIVRRNSCD